MPKASTAAAPAAAPAPIQASVAMTAPIPAPMAAPGFAVPAGLAPPRMASGDREAVATGLANKFNGRVESFWLLPRMYKTGKRAFQYQLFAEINIRADDSTLGHNGLVTEYFKIAGLNQWVPSRDIHMSSDRQTWVYVPAGSVNGQPATLDIYQQLSEGKTGFPTGKQNPDGTPELAILPPDDWRGWFAIPGAQNSADNWPRGTKWIQFLDELGRCEYKKKAPHISWGDFRQFLVGVYAHWVRMPFKFEGGSAPADADGKSIDTLCIAEILDLGPISGGGQTFQVQAQAPVAAVVAPVAMPASAPAPAPAINRNDPAAIEAAANAIITQLVVAKGPAGVTKAELSAPLFQGVNGAGLDGAKALLLANDNDWMEGDNRTFAYDRARGVAVPLG